MSKALALALANISSDYASASQSGRLRGNLISIPHFRTAQFIGTWQGFNEREQLSERLIKILYHPGRRDQHEPLGEPGRRIDYSNGPLGTLMLTAADRSAG